MSSINKWLGLGNLTRDPELRSTQSGASVCSFTLACNHRYKKDGEAKEEAYFMPCVAWGRTGETIHQYLAKGDPLFVEGRLKLNVWEDKENQRHERTELFVTSFTFMPKRESPEEVETG